MSFLWVLETIEIQWVLIILSELVLHPGTTVDREEISEKHKVLTVLKTITA